MTRTPNPIAILLFVLSTTLMITVGVVKSEARAAAEDNEKIAVFFEFDGDLAKTMEGAFAKALRTDRFDNIEPVRKRADADVHLSLYAESLGPERDLMGLAIVNDDGLSHHWTASPSVSIRSDHAPAMLAHVQHAGR